MCSTLSSCEQTRLQKLQQQLDKNFPNRERSYEYAEVRRLSYLDAILKETMRLKPAVPSGQPRVTPPGGLQIGDTWVRGDINVLVPQYSLQRDDQFFHRATELLPERWLEQKGNLILDEQTYFPFQFGKCHCDRIVQTLFMVNITRPSWMRWQGVCDDVHAHIHNAYCYEF